MQDSDVEVSQDFIALEVFPDMSLDSVKGFIDEEIHIPPQAQHFVYNGQQVLNTSQSLTSLGVGEGDVLTLLIRTRAPSQAQQQPQGRAQNTQGRARGQPAMPDPETFRLQILNNQGLLTQVRDRDPDIANAVHDPNRFAELFRARQANMQDAQREREEAMALLDSDPFNPDAQARIEEIIRQEQVMENMKKALDENPESFGRVIMLYIDVTVNNNPIKAFVDSGAQTTIMSPEAAEKCGIMRLIDKRYGGIARGVGTAKIIGRVHSADIQIGQYSLASSFTVMEGKGVDLLLGLDMLKRHQMCIDLKDNVLRIQSDAIPFLSENETPKGLDEVLDEEPTVKGPGNTEIGANTGTVKSASGTAQTAASNTPGPSGIRIHPQGSAGNVFTNQQQPQAQAPPQAVASTPAPQSQSTSLPASVTEQKIAQITELGFSRSEAIQALQLTNGNVEMAIGTLI